MKALLILLALVSLTAALVPRHRRAIHLEDENASKMKICASNTPCAWSIYKPGLKVIDKHVTNDYCVCGAGKLCLPSEDDEVANAYVYRCGKPERR